MLYASHNLKSAMTTFILFDIDGTLVSLDGAGSRSLNRAMEELLQVTDGFRGIDFAGKTDLQISQMDSGALTSRVKLISR
jgi:phosphoglycolate phosphatase-like HAD superfamily hydrolase